MDSLFIIISLVIVILTTIFILSNLLSKKTILLPGKTGLPLIGESIDYFNKLRTGINEKFVMERKLKYASDVFKTSILGENMAFLTGPEGNKFLFSNENKLVQVWWPSSVDSIIKKSHNKSAQAESAKVRVLLPPFLRAHAIKHYVSTMDSELRQHVADFWVGRDEVEVCPLVRKYTFALAVRLFLSVRDPGELEALARPFEEAAGGIIAIPINFPGTRFNRGIKASQRIRKVIGGIIEQRRKDLSEGKATPSQDLLSHMIVEVDRRNAENPDIAPATDSDISSDILGLLIGGYDTINTTIVFVMMTLVEYPDVYDQVLKEQREIAASKAPGELLNWDDLGKMKYSWNVACEVLRLRPPTVGAFRVAKTDFNYGGYTIPKGWKLHYIPHFTQKNPDYFPNPEKFDPSRFAGDGPAPYTFVPFGGGPRMCPGNEYARAEILVFMHNIILRYNWEKLIPNEKVVIDPLPRPSQGLPIRLIPHKA
uniref:Beta-amyrin 16-beta-monooxygenase n=1 Tax=Platycodon grandiflorus TaxID=94286 RepID=C7A14_PLAGD|nr:RecName: Full=Beta-amyrin 16-beta-monooxygenase; AltName: Full=Beta-amyrin 16-oxidase; AltName: Full=Cytochrome P450 716A141 [Platycodon grandiflorus]AOG74838.1 beta-amyrin 16-oxidase [Platycodon grandiflorus]BAX04008.1 cytochrome P450 716A141 [Platycodon grandiflorus]